MAWQFDIWCPINIVLLRLRLYLDTLIAGKLLFLAVFLFCFFRLFKFISLAKYNHGPGLVTDRLIASNYEFNPSCDDMYETFLGVTKKTTNHSSLWLLPLVPPLGWKHPNQLHWLHHQIMGYVVCAWFGRPTGPSKVIRLHRNIKRK